MIRKSDLIIVASSFNANFLNSSVSAPHKAVAIPLGPVKIPSSKGNLENQQSGLKIVFVGSINLRKGIPNLLEASRHLHETSQIQILGKASVETKNRIEKECLSNVSFEFDPNHEQILEAFREADVVVLPSYYEGFGLVVLEGMLAGCIPVCTINSGGPDILAGTILEKFLYDPFEQVSLIDTLSKLESLESSQILELKIEAIRIASSFSMEKYGDSAIKCIQEFIISRQEE